MKREPTRYEKASQQRIRHIIDTACDGSQKVFSEKVGIGKSSVSQYVNGTNFPGNLRAAQIANVFGLNPMWVMGFDVPMRSESNTTPLEEDAMLVVDRIKDRALSEALKVYFKLPQEKKAFVINTIYMLAKSD